MYHVTMGQCDNLPGIIIQICSSLFGFLLHNFTVLVHSNTKEMPFRKGPINGSKVQITESKQILVHCLQDIENQTIFLSR